MTKITITKTDNGYMCASKENEYISTMYNSHAFFILNCATGCVSFGVDEIDEIIHLLRRTKKEWNLLQDYLASLEHDTWQEGTDWP